MPHRIALTKLLAGMLLIWHGGLMAGSPATETRCVADSGSPRNALLELFTSEGCSSCPPADRWLSRLRADPDMARGIAPLAFHVDYWNRLGWVDRFSKPSFSARQRWIADVNRSRTIYTPQFVLDGRDAHPMQNGLRGFPSKREAAADLRLEIAPLTGARLDVQAVARLRIPSENAQLFLALYENNLSSRIAAGENAGSLLRHDFVVRELVGPIPMPASGEKLFKHAFDLGADWKRNDLGITAFVQNATTGETYQALQQPTCKTGR